LWQDFPLPAMTVFNLWKQRKMHTADAEHDLTFSRDYRALDVIRKIQDLAKVEQMFEEKVEAQKIVVEINAHAKKFISHPTIEKFMKSFDPSEMGRRGRWQPLAFVGSTDSGKTWKAMSLFPNQTLKVSCQGLPNGILPSLKEMDRNIHKAICFDEIRADQILGNRELFQSGPFPTKLAQSACGQHEYSVWLYGIAMLICTNSLEVNEKSLTYEADEEWLKHNVLQVMLQKGRKWYLI